MEHLKSLMERTVIVLTLDGRTIVGNLRGYDHIANIVLSDSFERMFSTTEGVETVLLGVYMIKGENVAVIGELDEEADRSIDWSNVRGEQPPPVTFGLF